MGNPVIVEAVRTPIGKRNGWLSGLHAAELLAVAQVELVKRAGIEPSDVEQIIGGCVTQAGSRAPTSPATRGSRPACLTSRRRPPSTASAAWAAGQQLRQQPDRRRRHRRGHRGGVEAMSRVGLGANVFNGPGSRPEEFPGTSPTSSVPPSGSRTGASPVRTSTGWGSRASARPPGRSRRAASSVRSPRWRSTSSVRTGPPERRWSSPRTRARGRAPPRGSRSAWVLPDGIHTAGNSSQISDGSAAVLWMSEERANADGFKPRAHRRPGVGRRRSLLPPRRPAGGNEVCP